MMHSVENCMHVDDKLDKLNLEKKEKLDKLDKLNLDKKEK